jgi:thiamine biosynthesis lipoprotein
VGERAVVVDGLATAMMVLGEVRGPALAASQGIAAYFIVRDGETIRGVASPAFDEQLAPAGSDRDSTANDLRKAVGKAE